MTFDVASCHSLIWIFREGYILYQDVGNGMTCHDRPNGCSGSTVVIHRTGELSSTFGRSRTDVRVTHLVSVLGMGRAGYGVGYGMPAPRLCDERHTELRQPFWSGERLD